ncbi:CocE/NonD family hydrolase [Nocardia sp. NPDC046763]|uniref:CocE/NonD family hydrolase n=1 Tax=Nocardia sp. NPDC046763 TaxID=3155256 RepID=UPI003410F463
MSQAHPGQLRLLAPNQESDALAVVDDLLTGNTAGVPEYLAEDIAAVRSRCGIRQVQIPGAGGVELDALIAWPRAEGPHPLIVLPAGLDKTGWKMYSGAVVRLLLRGYAVVAYTERGLPGSGGELTVAGPEDVADGYEVIEWALKHEELHADREKVGMAGISYGSGISQLVANAHPAVKAVVALSTWADLGKALYDNGTRHIMAAEALAGISDRPSEDLQKVLESFRANTDIDKVLDYARPRSPAEADQIRPVPTFFTSFWHETIFPQNQLIDYFDRFPGPKRLDLAIGDHGAVEIPGLLLGVYARTTEAAYDWFDHYLLGVDNGIDSDGVVHTETMYSFTMTSSNDLSAWSNPVRRYHLSAPSGASPDGTLVTDQPASMSQSFRAGTEQVQAATELVMDGFRERLLMPNRQPLADVDRTRAAVWHTRVFLRPRHIAGIPEIALTVTPSSTSATLITYLFDHNPVTGALRIITHAAATITNRGPEQTGTIRVPLQATDYRVPGGHRVVLIVDTNDHFYGDETEPGSVITLSSDHGPCYIDLPMVP